jgi:predicted DNA-binding protein YlxM (UPF0122 family)
MNIAGEGGGDGTFLADNSTNDFQSKTNAVLQNIKTLKAVSENLRQRLSGNESTIATLRQSQSHTVVSKQALLDFTKQVVKLFEDIDRALQQ